MVDSRGDRYRGILWRRAGASHWRCAAGCRDGASVGTGLVAGTGCTGDTWIAAWKPESPRPTQYTTSELGNSPDSRHIYANRLLKEILGSRSGEHRIQRPSMGFEMRIMRPLSLVSALIVGLISLASSSPAQPVRDRILAGVHLFEDAGCAVVKVKLNLPVRYLSHFPPANGDELRIKLRPILISSEDLAVLFKRESVRAPASDRAAIAKIIYEGDDLSGPVLTFLFRHPVAFKVRQGNDFRSLTVAISGEEPSETCLPIFPR